MTSDTPARSRPDDLTRTLNAAFHDRTLSPAVRWQYGTIDTNMVRLTAAADTADEARAFTTVVQAYALWHRGRPTTHPGKNGTNLGRAMRQIGKNGNYGPRDHSAVRSLDRVMVADTYADLHRAVVQVASVLAAADHPPHWQTLADDLTQWQASPATRDEVRMRWARGFHKATPKPTPADATNN